MPLPPKPKRPLGPPVLFEFRCVPIRTRADAIEASGSWEEFLDDVADHVVDGLDSCLMPPRLTDAVERLVSPAELQAHREAMLARIRERREVSLAVVRKVLDTARSRREAPRSLFDRLFRRAV